MISVEIVREYKDDTDREERIGSYSFLSLPLKGDEINDPEEAFARLVVDRVFWQPVFDDGRLAFYRPTIFVRTTV